MNYWYHLKWMKSRRRPEKFSRGPSTKNNGQGSEVAGLVHWIFQAHKPKDARVEGLIHQIRPSKGPGTAWYRGACVMCGRSIDPKCQQCRVRMAVHRIEVRYQFYMQQRISSYLTKLRRWIRRGRRGRWRRLSEFEGSDIFEREIKYLLIKE